MSPSGDEGCTARIGNQLDVGSDTFSPECLTAELHHEQVMTQPGAVVKEEVVRALIVLISNAPDLHGYSARAFYSALKARPDAEFALVMASTWIIGMLPFVPRAPSPDLDAPHHGYATVRFSLAFQIRS